MSETPTPITTGDTFARVVDSVIVEPPILLPAGMTPDAIFAGDHGQGWVDITGATPSPGEGWTTTDGGKTFAAPTVTTPEIDLPAYAAQARFAKEVGGIKVGTAQIDTSRESQSMVANAYAFMQQSGATTTQYKTDSGWVTVTADQMKAIALAVGKHVQDCFATEADLDAKITAGTVTTTAKIDATFAALTT